MELKLCAGLLAPANPSSDFASYGIDKSNSDGSFEMKSVRPGDYVLLAAETEDLEYTNPAAVQRYLEHAIRLHVEVGREYKEVVRAQ
jgi:hypothetical protein